MTGYCMLAVCLAPSSQNVLLHGFHLVSMTVVLFVCSSRVQCSQLDDVLEEDSEGVNAQYGPQGSPTSQTAFQSCLFHDLQKGWNLYDEK